MNKKKYILVLDLDETLFHTSGNNLYIRPGTVDFIKSLYPHFYLIVFTAATKNYADEMLDKIGISDYFLKKFYRPHLTKSGYKDLKTVLRFLIQEKIKYHNKQIKTVNIKKNNYVSDIINMDNSILVDKNNNINFNNIIIIDNLVENFKDTQRANGINIIDFTTDKKDNCLKMIKEFLLQMVFLKTKNVREYLSNNLYFISKYIKYIPTSNFTLPIKIIPGSKKNSKKDKFNTKKNSKKDKSNTKEHSNSNIKNSSNIGTGGKTLKTPIKAKTDIKSKTNVKLKIDNKSKTDIKSKTDDKSKSDVKIKTDIKSKNKKNNN